MHSVLADTFVNTSSPEPNLAEGIPSPSRVVPDLLDDARVTCEANADCYLATTRFYLGVCLQFPNAGERIVALTDHYGTAVRALRDINLFRETYEHVALMSVVLIFDPTKQQEVDRYHALCGEAEAERAAGN